MTAPADIWSGLAQVLGYEPRRDETSLPGLSGHNHEFAHIAVDQKARRILAVSRELDPRMAAMIHADVSAAFDDYQVLSTRPLTFDLQRMALTAGELFGGLRFAAGPIVTMLQRQQQAAVPPRLHNQSSLEYIQNALGQYAPIVMPFFTAASLSGLGPAEQLILLIREASLLDWPAMLPKDEDSNPQFSIEPLTRLDSQAWDRQFGLCPFPLYELAPEDWELFRSASDLDAINERLLALGVRQYFYPPIDQAALGIIDRGVSAQEEVGKAVETLPAMGHPTVQAEFLDPSVKAIEIIDALRKRGMVDEADVGIVVTAQGAEVRANVRKRPREGAISKVIRKVVRVDLSTRNWFSNITLKAS